MGLHGGDARANNDFAFGADLMADPAHPDLPGVQHPARSPQRLLGLVHGRRLYGVHQPPVDLQGGLAEAVAWQRVKITTAGTTAARQASLTTCKYGQESTLKSLPATTAQRP